MRRVGNQNLGNTGDFGSSLSRGSTTGTSNQNMHIATQLGSSGNGVQGARLDAGVIVFSNYQYAHLDNLCFVLQFATSSATLAT